MAENVTPTYDITTKAVLPANLIFDGPQAANVPSAANDLTNKTYVDAAIVTGSTFKTWSLPTVAAMQALASTVRTLSGVLFKTAGRNTPGDGGSATFYWSAASTAAVNLGTVFAATVEVGATGRYIWIGDGPIDVRMFGAFPNDGLDDTAAVQSAIDFASLGGAGLSAIPVVFPTGQFNIDYLTVNGLSELSGAPGWVSDYNQGTVLYQRSGVTGSFLRIGVTANLFRQPYIHDLCILGRKETNATGHVAITAVTSRTSFTVAVGNLPASNAASATWPYYGHVFFYSALDGGTRRFLGSGWVSGIDYGTGVVTLRSQTDWYATPSATGNSLTTAMSVIFTPPTTIDAVTVYASCYAPAGNIGIEIGAGGYARVERVLVEGFHVPLVTRDNAAIVPLSDSIIRGGQFANLCNWRGGATQDQFYKSLYVQGYYQTDYDLPAATIPVVNDVLRRTPFGIWGPGFGDNYVQTVMDGNLCGAMWARAYDVDLNSFFLDAVIGGIWLEGASSMPMAFNGDVVIRPLFLTKYAEAGIAPDLVGLGIETFGIRSTAPAGTTFDLNRSGTHRVYTTINNAGINPTFKYDHIFDLASGTKANISMPNWDMLNGATLLYKAATVPPDCGAVRNDAVTTAATAKSQWFWPTTHGVSYAANSVAMLQLDTTGAIIGDSTLGTALTVKGGSGGVLPLILSRPAVGSVLLGPVADGFKVVNNTSGFTILEAYDVSGTQTQIYLGGATASSTPRIATILGKPASGADTAASETRILTPTGTGSSTTSGRVAFYTPDAGASSSTAQTQTEKVSVEREGQLSLYNRTADPTVNVTDGQVFYRSDLDVFRARANGAWVSLSGNNTGDQTITLTGDVTGSGTGSFATTLATVASAGTTGGSTAIPVVTIDAKGRTTGITTAAVVAPAGTLTGATLASGVTASSLTSVGTLTALTAGNVTDSALTSGRLVLASTAGLLADNSSFTYSGNTMSIGAAANGTSLTIDGNASGVHVLKLTRSGASYSGGIGVVSGGISLYDLQNSRGIGLFTAASGVLNQWTGGTGAGGAAPKALTILAEPASSGTDTAGSILTLGAGAGTGAGAPGNMLFRVAGTLGTGTTVQSVNVTALTLAGNTGAATFGSSVAIGSGTAITKYISGSKTFDFPSVASLGTTTTTVTVTGAAVGDLCTCGLTTLTTEGLMLNANVSAANTVTVVLFNPTAGAVDLASGTLRVGVWQH